MYNKVYKLIKGFAPYMQIGYLANFKRFLLFLVLVLVSEPKIKQNIHSLVLVLKLKQNKISLVLVLELK